MRTKQRSREGFALVLALVALVALTVLGLTAIQISSLDLEITHNIRRYHQVYNAANTGLDQAIAMTRTLPVNQVLTDEISEAASGGGCKSIVSDDAATDDPTPLETGGYTIATYTVDRCYGECGGVARGYEATQGINQGGGGDGLRNVYLDTCASARDITGTRQRSAARADTAGFLRVLGYCY